MHREVFADRPGHVLTVGEMPDVTLTDAVLFTDPARREVDMVFQFEHVRLDFGAHRYDPLPLEAARAQAVAGDLAGGARRARLELAVLRQPRPTARRVPVR
jgi:oligo-1,6-glucosidase